jgi:chloramphenicol-sensitive protein RarD
LSATTAQAKQDVRDGLVAGLIAYTLWGILPVYFKLVESVLSTEVLLHRIIWAIPFGALIIHLRRQWPEVATALKHRQMLIWLTITAVLIAVNWYVYIVAIQTDRIFQASLGYYINPLIFVVAGVFVFGEKLRGMQTGAVVLAAIGVLVLTFSGGELPVISLFLGTSFTIYGVVRKHIVIGAMPGLFIETLVLVPIAIIWLGWMFSNGQAEFGYAGPGITGLLLLAGPITVVPLLMFAIAAKRLSLTSVGFMQFLAPTLQFATAVYYGEALTLPRLVCFACIWGAVILFSIDAIKNSRRREAPTAA